MSTAPVFLVESLPERGDLVLDGPEGRHAAAVRRLRPGEQVRLSDGAGTVADGTVVTAGRDQLVVSVRDRTVVEPFLPRLVAVQALPKGDRGELAVELMTELGVDEIVPWAASRSITQWRGDRGERAVSRWRSTAREASKQSRRAWLPVVAPPAETPQVADRILAAGGGLVLHEAATTALTAAPLPAGGAELVIVIGPEGGLADPELAAFERAGALAVRLGPTVLRTSTAGAAALAVLSARTGRWT